MSEHDGPVSGSGNEYPTERPVYGPGDQSIPLSAHATDPTVHGARELISLLMEGLKHGAYPVSFLHLAQVGQKELTDVLMGKAKKDLKTWMQETKHLLATETS